MTVTHRSQQITGTQRDAWVEINLAALERNFIKLKDIVKTEIMAVVKADGYGHGACAIAPILQSLNINSFGVATVDEGLALRNSGIKTPIVILGATPFWSYESCIKNNLTITIYSEEQLAKLDEYCKKNNSKINIQLKIDTGMNRLGVEPEKTNIILEEIIENKNFNLTGIFSHLSDANNKDFSLIQKDRFDSTIQKLKVSPGKDVKYHIANTYAGINYAEFRYDLVRIGIGLYGQEYSFLEPLISVKGRITEIHSVKKGEYVSYDRTWQAEKDSLIATIPVGYADGVDRRLSNKISGIYKGKKIKQVGLITMDQMMFDISEIETPLVNDVICLIDRENPISNWANILNTITYELICRLRLRLPRIYTRD